MIFNRFDCESNDVVESKEIMMLKIKMSMQWYSIVLIVKAMILNVKMSMQWNSIVLIVKAMMLQFKD
jgi:hypothetical protein